LLNITAVTGFLNLGFLLLLSGFGISAAAWVHAVFALAGLGVIISILMGLYRLAIPPLKPGRYQRSVAVAWTVMLPLVSLPVIGLAAAYFLLPLWVGCEAGRSGTDAGVGFILVMALNLAVLVHNALILARKRRPDLEREHVHSRCAG
jgi:hypothetical protein